MDSSVSPKDEIWFLRVGHHISNAVYESTVPDSHVFFVYIDNTCRLYKLTLSGQTQVTRHLRVSLSEGFLAGPPLLRGDGGGGTKKRLPPGNEP